VVRLMDKGVVVDVGNDIEGFVPMSQLGVPDIQQPGDAVKEGQVCELKVLEVDPIHHRIVLAAIGFPDEPLKEIKKPVIEAEESGEAAQAAAAPEAQAPAPQTPAPEAEPPQA
jgi:small subunit ribosomal protein S1